VLDPADILGQADKHKDREDMRRIGKLLLPVLAAAVLAAGWVGWTADAVGPVLLWVFAALLAGGTAGFLFGIPKSGSFTKIDVSPPNSPGAAASSKVDITAAHGREDTGQRARPNTYASE
jgi:hypothetical protein